MADYITELRDSVISGYTGVLQGLMGEDKKVGFALMTTIFGLRKKGVRHGRERKRKREKGECGLPV